MCPGVRPSFQRFKTGDFFYNFVVNLIQTRLPHPACFYFRITSIFGVHIYPTTPTPPANSLNFPPFFHNCFFFVLILVKRPGKQFFSHVETEPPIPGYYQYFWGVNVSCSISQLYNYCISLFRSSRPRPCLF